MVAIENGMRFDGFMPYENLRIPAKLMIRSSFLVNYFYWLFPNTNAERYTHLLTDAFNNEHIFEEHTSDLQNFIDFAEKHQSELIVLIFPFLTNIELSEQMYTQSIGNFFENQGIRAVQVSELVENITVKNRIINSNDAHASKKVQKVVADEIIRKLEQY